MTDQREFFEIDFLRDLTWARRMAGLDPTISDADHDIARDIAFLNERSNHTTVKE